MPWKTLVDINLVDSIIPEPVFHHTAIAVDALVGAAVLLAVWLACEWWIRRRDARKGT